MWAPCGECEVKTKVVCAFAALTLAAGAPAAAAVPTFFGPSAYLSFADSPFDPADYNSFHLEDLEDGLFNTPGVSVTGPAPSGVCITHSTCALTSVNVDSVGNGGDGTVGHSFFSAGRMEFTFDAGVLGSLPVVAGLVWTDGNNPIHFEAYDGAGVLLGALSYNGADNAINGTLAEDRFFGVAYAGGIGRLVIFDNPGLEVDHLQFGLVPEPAAWAVMLAGFGLAGGLLRSRRRGQLV
jgi:hypothetical protein